jgi:hypothetical protein
LNSTITVTSQIRLNGPSGATSPLRLDFDYWWIKVKFPVVLALGLPLLNFAWMRLAIALTEFENYPDLPLQVINCSQIIMVQAKNYVLKTYIKRRLREMYLLE